MRKIYLSFIVLASITACTIEKPATVGVQKFTAVAVGNDIPTRSHIAYPNSESDATNPDGKIVHWDKGDKFYLYDTELRDFTAQDEGGDVTISGEVADWFDDTYYGIYPQSAYRGFSGTTYTTYIPVNQYVDESSNWDPNAPVVVGHCNWDERLIKFYNAHCLVEMYLPGSASSLTLRMMDGSAAGDMTIDVATLATNVIKGNDMVTMTGSMPAHSPIYLVVTPTVSSSGVAVYAYFSSSFTINGETYNAGEYAFRNTNSASFGRDRIVVMNLSNTVPALLNCERLGAHLPDGTMLLRSVDGTCTLNKTQGGSVDKEGRVIAPVYDMDKQGPLTETQLNNYQYNRSGWHNACVNDADGLPTYPIQLEGTGSYNGKYLRYDAELQGFYMVDSAADATYFYVYILPTT